MHTLTANTQAKRSSPGEEIVWYIIFGEMTILTLCFAIYVYFRQLSYDQYIEAQHNLLTGYGLTNTLILVLSSFFVASAVSAYRSQNQAKVCLFLKISWFFGALFCAIKIQEFLIMLDNGWYFDSHDFYIFYYTLAGIHLMHVFIGLMVLSYFLYGISSSGIHSMKESIFESGTSYWHMIDIVWLLLFPLLYLLP
ncbi:cytochrome c oxidase subunit 3 [Alteromonas sp. M12]|uniref:cytochrome c oxidase subunit 3 n=1 Tax=Alteromonas sp. M12 TaxID=3135644 RepID=UPI00319DF685